MEIVDGFFENRSSLSFANINVPWLIKEDNYLTKECSFKTNSDIVKVIRPWILNAELEITFKLAFKTLTI